MNALKRGSATNSGLPLAKGSFSRYLKLRAVLTLSSKLPPPPPSPGVSYRSGDLTPLAPKAPLDHAHPELWGFGRPKLVRLPWSKLMSRKGHVQSCYSGVSLSAGPPRKNGLPAEI